MKKLLLDSLALCKDLVLLRAAREIYIVMAAALAAGVVAGSLL